MSMSKHATAHAPMFGPDDAMQAALVSFVWSGSAEQCATASRELAKVLVADCYGDVPVYRWAREACNSRTSFPVLDVLFLPAVLLAGDAGLGGLGLCQALG